jgi:hypothetical protein
MNHSKQSYYNSGCYPTSWNAKKLLPDNCFNKLLSQDKRQDVSVAYTQRKLQTATASMN